MRFISGGQTGVDRGVLDACLDRGFPCGGYCPAGRQAEDGTIPEHYPLREMNSDSYPARTRANVEAAEGTVILAPGSLTGGTAFSRECCRRLGRPFIEVDPENDPDAVQKVLAFCRRLGVVDAERPEAEVRINWSGPRASGWAEGARHSRRLAEAVIDRLQIQ